MSLLTGEILFVGTILKSTPLSLAAALTRVMRAAVTIPAVAAASVSHSAVVGGSVVGVVEPL